MLCYAILFYAMLHYTNRLGALYRLGSTTLANRLAAGRSFKHIFSAFPEQDHETKHA